MSRKSLDPTTVGLVALAAALNLGIGAVVGALKLPMYLDSIGTILATALGGWVVGLTVGLLSILVATFVIAPTSWAYASTVVAIVFATHLFLRFGYLRRVLPTILGGLLVGVASALTAAPVTTLLFGGVSLSGADAVTAFLRVMGQNLSTSVLLGGLATDPVDKLASSLMAWLLLRTLPQRILSRFPRSGAGARASSTDV